jgi:hypothetical protein
LTLQLLFAGRIAGQSSVCVKPADAVMLFSARDADPSFERTANWPGDDVPTDVLENVSDVGEKLILTAGAAPVPDNINC